MFFMTIKTKGRYPVYKLMLILWRGLRLQFFLEPQIKKIKEKTGEIYITPETISYMDVLCQLRFGGLSFLDGRDAAILYMLILNVPKDEFETFCEIFLDYRARGDDYNFDRYIEIVRDEYHTHRKYSNSFYEFNLSMKRNDKFRTYSNYLVVKI